MQKRYLLLFSSSFFVFIWLTLLTDRAEAQNLDWTAPAIISNPENDSQRPEVVADPTGVVHIFWFERLGTGDQRIGSGYIVHTSIIDGKPLDANEIHVTELYADYLSVVATPDGYLHLAWVERPNSVYYSRAWALEAHDAQSWSNPRVIAGPGLIATMIGDERGRLHLVYSPEDQVALSYIQSIDGGIKWSAPYPIDSTSEAPFVVNARLAIDQRGNIHLAWFNSDIDHWGLEAYYARSTNEGESWSDPMLVDSISKHQYTRDYGPAWINIAVTDTDDIHLVWDGAPSGQRWEQISTDGGVTWQDQNPLFGDLRGITGLNALKVDGSDTLHLITGRLAVRDQDNLMFASRVEDEWGVIEPLPGSLGSNERPSTAIANGNQLFVAWESDPEIGTGIRRIVYSQTLLNAPFIKPISLPTPLVGTETGKIENQPAISSPASTTNAEGVPKITDDEVVQSVNPAYGLFVGISSSLGFILVCLLVRWILIRWRN